MIRFDPIYRARFRGGSEKMRAFRDNENENNARVFNQ